MSGLVRSAFTVVLAALALVATALCWWRGPSERSRGESSQPNEFPDDTSAILRSGDLHGGEQVRSKTGHVKRKSRSPEKGPVLMVRLDHVGTLDAVFQLAGDRNKHRGAAPKEESTKKVGALQGTGSRPSRTAASLTRGLKRLPPNFSAPNPLSYAGMGGFFSDLKSALGPRMIREVAVGVRRNDLLGLAGQLAYSSCCPSSRSSSFSSP